MKKSGKKIGELLLERGFIDEFHLNAALSYQSEWGGRLGSILIRKGFISEKDMSRAIEEQFGLSCVNLDDIEKPRDEVLRMVPLESAKKYGIFPIGLEGKTVLMAMSDPTDLKTLDDIGFSLGLRTKPVLALESDIMRAIAVYYEGEERSHLTVNKARAALMASREAQEQQDIVDGEIVEAGREAGATGPASAGPASEASQKIVIESLVDLLVSKGVITKAELIRLIKSKKQP
jgi:hypothetical protein